MRFALAVVFMFTTMIAAGQGVEDKVGRVADPVHDEYIVRLNDTVEDPKKATAALLQRFGGEELHRYRRAFKGFAVRLPDAAAQALARSPMVAAVEENAIGFPSSTSQTVNSTYWHLDRIDGSGLNGTYHYCDDTEVNDIVVVYVFDTGMRRTHQEFVWENPPISGIACTNFTPPCPAVSTNGYNFIGDGYGATNVDSGCAFGYHGQAVASLIAGRHIGVAQAAYVWPVRIGACNGSKTMGDVLAGIDKVLDERTGGAGVANFSFWFGGPASSFTNFSNALQAMRDDGIVVVASANNFDQDRCNSEFPAGFSHVFTVGGTFGGTSTNSFDTLDRRVTGVETSGAVGSGSNYGSCVDIFAPGFHFDHAKHGSDTDYEGPRDDSAATSYSAALVSGAFARYFAEYPTASVQTAEAYILSQATGSVDLYCDKEQDDYNASNDSRESYSACVNTTTKFLRVTPECD